MSPLHLILALLVVTIWGINFIFIKIDLVAFSPLLLCAMRFILASIPAIFFIPLPKAAWRDIAFYGLIMFGLQFSFIFIGMALGMTAGMASILMQTQVFFSMFFSSIALKDRPNPSQIIGALVSFLGVAMVGFHFDSSITFSGLIFIIAGSAAWGYGNLMAKKLGHLNMISLVVWGSFFAAWPVLALALLIEGPSSISYTYHHISGLGITALMYIVYVSTWLGYGIFNLLLSRYPVSTVAPFTFLVPVVSMISSALLLNEPLPAWKLWSATLVVAGLGISMMPFGLRRRTKVTAP